MKMIGRLIGIVASLCAFKWGAEGLIICLLLIAILWGLFEFLSSAFEKELEKNIRDKENGTNKWK